MILENNKFIFENPDYVPLSMGPRRYELVSKLDNTERRKLAAYELMLDNFEFLYLVGLHDNKKHAEHLARRLLSNPEIKRFLQGDLKGTFRKKFEKIIDEVLRNDGQAPGK